MDTDTCAYRLIAVTDGIPDRLVGEYPTYREALGARGDDVYARLVANHGRWVRIEHHIIGPGLQGPHTVHPFCTELGVDPDGEADASAATLADARAWLTALHSH
jgi:hypothetical protein